MDEHPEYFVFNGAVGALTAEHPLHAKTGETVRIYFGVGGPNFISSFHVIGTNFDRVYNSASLTSPPQTSVHTTVVPPGGATVVDLSVPVPGRWILVDHALARMERGLVGALIVEGPPAPDLFHPGDATQTAVHPATDDRTRPRLRARAADAVPPEADQPAFLRFRSSQPSTIATVLSIASRRFPRPAAIV